MTAGAEARRSARLPLALVAVACGIVVLAGVLITVLRSPRVSGNRQVNPSGLIDANNSPDLVRNPRQPTNLVVVHRVDRPRFAARLEVSTDDGRHWAPTELPLPAGLDRPYAPDAAFGPDGTLHVVYSNLEGSGNRPGNLWVSSSTDGGRTLSSPSRVAAALAFQPRLAVSADGAIHVVWLQAADVGLLSLGTGPNPVVTSVSTDGGRTFAPPVRVTDPDVRRRVGAASVVVDGGAVVVLYQDFGEDRRDFENLEGPPWDEPSALVLARSEDGGSTFPGTGVEVDTEVVLTRRFFPFAPEYPSLAVGSGGLYVAWADGRNGDLDVFLRRSTDGGRTWAEPVRVNRNRRADGTSQYLPRVAVAPDGRVDVVFLDRRQRENVLTDVTLASSNDGGRTFSDVRVSSRSFDSRIGPAAGPLLEVDLGTRLGLLAEHGRSIAVWTDTRLGTADTDRQDIAFATIDAGDDPLLTRVPLLVGVGLLGALALLAAARAGAGRLDGGDTE